MLKLSRCFGIHFADSRLAVGVETGAQVFGPELLSIASGPCGDGLAMSKQRGHRGRAGRSQHHLWPPLLSLQMGKGNLNHEAFTRSFLSFALSAWGPSSLRRPPSKAQGPWCFHDRELNPSKCFLPSSLGKCSPEFRLVFQFYDSTGNCFLGKCLQLERPSNMLRESQTHLAAIPSSNPAAPWLLTGKAHSVLQGRSLLPSLESGCTREGKSRGHFVACLACNFG